MVAASKEAKLDLAEMRRALVGTRFAAGLHHFASIDSTNTQLLEAAASGAAEGAVYLADEQTAGRGRGGHAWHSAPGEGLYLSALGAPSLKLREALWLSLATGLAAQAAIHATTGTPRRHPLAQRLAVLGKLKCGGILVETAVEPGDDPALRYAVIGIGINVNHASFPAELQSTSLPRCASQPAAISTQPPAAHRSHSFASSIANLQCWKPAARSCLSASHWPRPGCAASACTCPSRVAILVTTNGLDSRGFLLVLSDDGVQRTVLSGGVRELYGQRAQPKRGRQARCYWHST